jgi:hypothetical protein
VLLPPSATWNIMFHNTEVHILATVGAIGASLAILGAVRTISDKEAWTTYGSGGTPPTWKGYARIRLLRVVSYFFPRDLSNASRLSAHLPRYLETLPRREGSRPPVTHWFLPQRQAPPHMTSQPVRNRLQALCACYAKAYPDLLRVDLSETEGRSTDAIYAKRADMPGRNPAALNRFLGDEICHVHPVDNSLHVWCSDADAKEVVEKGWGLLFPLAPMKIVNAGWVFVYAPRNEKELGVVDKIVRAGIANVTGVAVEKIHLLEYM